MRNILLPLTVASGLTACGTMTTGVSAESKATQPSEEILKLKAQDLLGAWKIEYGLNGQTSETITFDRVGPGAVKNGYYFAKGIDQDGGTFNGWYNFEGNNFVIVGRKENYLLSLAVELDPSQQKMNGTAWIHTADSHTYAVQGHRQAP